MWNLGTMHPQAPKKPDTQSKPGAPFLAFFARSGAFSLTLDPILPSPAGRKKNRTHHNPCRDSRHRLSRRTSSIGPQRSCPKRAVPARLHKSPCKTAAALASFEPNELRSPQRTAQAPDACKGSTLNWEKSEDEGCRGRAELADNFVYGIAVMGEATCMPLESKV
jgi:hypothetical protein